MKFSALIFSCFFFLVACLLFPSLSFAQTKNEPVGNYPSANTNPDVPNNLHNWTQNVMIEVMSSLTCQLAGIDPINPKQGCLGIDSKSGKIGFLPSPQTGGAIGFMGNMIATLYTPPLHTGDYFQNLAQNFGITKKSYAQVTGTGFDGLKPLLNLWTVFRNIAYLVFVIVFVVIGLAIMLRVKIDPRTVMTIQNQIPKIIIGILLVTFSYAIAGFLIDLMYILSYLFTNIIAQADPEITSDISEIVQSTNPFSAANQSFRIGDIVTRSAGGVGEIVREIIPLPNIFPLNGILSGIVSILAAVIITIALLIALFRLWITLLMAYVYILLDVVLAPFWIIGGIVPGSPINISGWFRDIIANLAAFPATIVMFMLGKVFMDAFGCNAKTQACKDALTHNFVPPLIGNPGDPSLIGSLIGLGIILMTPNVVNMLKAALKAPKIDTGGAFKALGVGAGAPMEILNKGGSIGLSLSGLSSVPGVNRLPFINKIRGGAKP